MELDFLWRKEEIFFLKNQLNSICKDDDKNRYRKSLVLILYSHLEGFIKICLLTYIQHLNSLQIKRKEVNKNLAASSLEREFKAYDSNDAKCKIFKQKLPDDTKLHKLYRRVHLLENLSDFEDEILFIEDEAINTESNLWYVVLQKNLYKSGLPVDLFDEFKRDIDRLVETRNALAHGSLKSGIEEQEYNNWECNILKAMEDIITYIYNFTANKKYMKE